MTDENKKNMKILYKTCAYTSYAIHIRKSAHFVCSHFFLFIHLFELMFDCTVFITLHDLFYPHLLFFMIFMDNLNGLLLNLHFIGK